jgi:hypothetical protein
MLVYTFILSVMSLFFGFLICEDGHGNGNGHGSWFVMLLCDVEVVGFFAMQSQSIFCRKYLCQLR